MSKVSILDIIETSLTPYTVTFSPDGNSLAYGLGCYYGAGNIVIQKPGGEIIAQLVADGEKRSETSNFSVSGLCFDSKARYLAASLWAASHWYHPAKLFKIEDGQIEEVETLGEDFSDLEHQDLEYRGYATGIAITANKIIVRRSCCPDHTITTFALDKEINGDKVPVHLTSARLALVGDAVVTGCHRPRVLTQEVYGKPVKIVTFGDGRESISSNLLFKWLDSKEDHQIIGMPHVVSAICANQSGSKLITGGADGSIAFWRYENPMDLKLIDDSILKQSKLIPACTESNCQTQSSSIYDGNSIVAICFLPEENYLVTAEASGHLRIWQDETLVGSFHTNSGSPRSIASHPVNSNLAIASKASQGKGNIEIVDLNSIL